MSTPQGDDGQGGQYFLARMGEQLLIPGLPPPQPAPAGVQYKRCNCKKAKCLKLYCVCFGAGVYCQGCNCVDCSNVPDKQHVVFQERQRVLQREPMAFTSKVVGPAHFKGCKCRKSRCVKKYCDCFDAKVRCSEICKCKDCQNQPGNYPGAGGVASMAQLQQQQQPGSLLVALQQQQYVGDGMEADLSTLARMQLLQQQQQEQAMAAELQQQHSNAGQHPGLLLNSQPGSEPPSQPGSRAVSPQPANLVVGRSGAQLGAIAAVPAPGQRHMPASVVAVAAASSAAACDLSINSGGPRPQLIATSNAFLTSQPGVQPTAATMSWGPLDQIVGVVGDAGSLPVIGTGLQLLQQGAWQQLQPAASAGLASLHKPELQEVSAAVQQQAAMAAVTVMPHTQEPRHASRSSGDREGSLPTEQVLCAEDGLTETTQQQQREQRSREPSVSLAACRAAQSAEAAAATGEDSQQKAGTDMLPDLAAEGAGGTAANQAQHLIKVEPELTAAAAAAPCIRSRSSLVVGESLNIPAPAQGRLAGARSNTGTGDEHLAVEDASIVKADQQMQQHQQLEVQKGEVLQGQSVAEQAQQQMQSMMGMNAAQCLPGHEADHTLLQQDGLLQQPPARTVAGHSLQQQPAVNTWAASAAFLRAHPVVTAAEIAAATDATAPLANSDLQQQFKLVCSSALLSASHALTAAAGVSTPDNPAAAATAADGGGSTAHGLDFGQGGSAAAAGLTALDASLLLADPACAGQLAQSAGLGESIAMAAMNAAQFLKDIISLSRIGPTAMGMQAAAVNDLATQQQPTQGPMHAQRDQPQLSRLRHGAVGSPAPGSTTSQVAVLTDKPLAAIAASMGTGAAGPIVSGAARSSPAMPSNTPLNRHVAATTPHAPPASAAAAAAAAPAGVGASGLSGFGACASVAKGLSTLGGVAGTPSPLTSHALRHGGGSFRGPSPLGPVGAGTREAAGLQALMGSSKHQHSQHQQQINGTPVAAPPHMHSSMAPGSGTSSAAGGPGGSGSARRSMQLLPGSFRLTGANQSPAVSHGSPATAPMATSAMLAHAFGIHLAPAAHKYDSPAGSISLAPSVASAGPNDEAATYQEQTPVFSNSLKAQQLQEQQEQKGDQQLQLEQQEQQHQAELPSSSMAFGAGAQTPISELTMAAAAAAAAAGTSAAPTPTFWQQQAHQVAELDQLMGLNLFSSGQGATGPSLHDMTPSSLLIASLLAAGSTPTDMFLTSPLPPIASALRAAAATGGPASGIRAPGRRGGEITPVLIDIGHAAMGSGSTGPRQKGGALQRVHTGRAKSGVGVSALCTGWSSGVMAAPAPVAARDSSTGAAAANTSVAAAAVGPSDSMGAATAAAAAPGSQHDAPASGIKADTDKAAARAVAAASGDAALQHEVPGLTVDVCDAGVSSLLAAASFILTPGYEDEVPAKRRRQDAGTAADPIAEQTLAHSQGHKQHHQLGRAELDIKHTADATVAAGKLVTSATAAAAVDGLAVQAAVASDVGAYAADTCRTLLEADTAAENAGCLSSHGKKAQPSERHNSGGSSQQQEWGSQVETTGVSGIHGLANSLRGSQEQPELQLQRGQKRSFEQVQQQEQLPRVVDKMELENVEPHMPLAEVHAAAAAHAGVHQPPRKQHAAARLQGCWNPGSPAAPSYKYPPASAAKLAAAAAAGADQNACLLQSPPVRPTYAVKGTADRSPSIESFAAADAMLALCDPLHFRQR